MTSNLCENCHQRPKFGTHKFCGRTCAAQAAAKPAKPKPARPRIKGGTRTATRRRAPAPHKASVQATQLCIYCGQKPKFNNFDYCGKTCASLAAAAQTKPSATQWGPGTKQRTSAPAPSGPSKNAPAPPAPPAQRGVKAPLAKSPVPQYDSTEYEEFDEEDEEDGGFATDVDAYPSDPELEDEQNEPTVPAAKPKYAPKFSKQSGNQKPPAGTCAIPGCGQPCHVDRNGVKTGYCSMKHREEAVSLGLENACIMCQRYPQGASDYFCSSTCRNQSMTKT